MKLPLLISVFLSSTLLAQNPEPLQPRRRVLLPQPVPMMQGQAESLPANYLVTLSISDKNDAPFEWSLVTASTRFSASLAERGLTFTGTLNLEESAGALLTYTLAWQTGVPTPDGVTEIQSSNAQSSVRLKVGEELEVLHSATRSVRLSIRKIEPGK